jgi:hypothetical protein
MNKTILNLIESKEWIDSEMFSGREVEDTLIAAGYTNLGWLNDNKSEATKMYNNNTLNGFERAFKNYTGSYTINVDKFKRYYCVDMGD